MVPHGSWLVAQERPMGSAGSGWTSELKHVGTAIGALFCRSLPTPPIRIGVVVLFGRLRSEFRPIHRGFGVGVAPVGTRLVALRYTG